MLAIVKGGTSAGQFHMARKSGTILDTEFMTIHVNDIDCCISHLSHTCLAIYHAWIIVGPILSTKIAPSLDSKVHRANMGPT